MIPLPFAGFRLLGSTANSPTLGRAQLRRGMIGFDQRGREFQFGTASMYLLVSGSIRSAVQVASALWLRPYERFRSRMRLNATRLDRAAIEALIDPANTSADARIY